MHRSQRNFFLTSSESSSTTASGSAESSNRKFPPPPTHDKGNKKGRKGGIAKVVAENAIVIVALRGCFMCITLNELVHKLGVNPKIIEIEEVEKIVMSMNLSKIEGSEGGSWELSAVYVGEKLLGDVDKVMNDHVKGEFVPMHSAAGALWL